MCERVFGILTGQTIHILHWFVLIQKENNVLHVHVNSFTCSSINYYYVPWKRRGKIQVLVHDAQVTIFSYYSYPYQQSWLSVLNTSPSTAEWGLLFAPH